MADSKAAKPAKALFRIAPNPSFWASVWLSIPGEAEKVEVEMEFAHRTREGYVQWRSSPDKSNADMLMETIKAWRGIDREFNRENLELLLENYPASASEITEIYEFQLFRTARRKN